MEVGTLLEEFRRRHRCAVAPPCAPALRPNHPRLVNALQLSDLMPEVNQQLTLIFKLLSTDFTLDVTNRKGMGRKKNEATSFLSGGLARRP